MQPAGGDAAVCSSSAQSGELVVSRVVTELGGEFHARGLAGLCVTLGNTDTTGGSTMVLSSCPGLS